MFSGHCSGLIHSIFSSIFIQHFISPEINELSSCHVNLIMTHFSNLFFNSTVIIIAMCDYGVVTMPRRIYIVFLEVQVGLLWRFSWGPTQDLCSKGQQGSPSGGWPSGHSGHSVLCLGSSRPINLDDSGPTGLGNLVSLTQEARDQWDQVVPRVAQALGALPLGGAGQLPPDTQSTGFSAGWDCAGCSWLAGSDRSQLTCLVIAWQAQPASV